MESSPSRWRGGRPVPTAECRLCSVVEQIAAETPDDLRQDLRAFMTRHRHGGLADIVIDLCDDEDREPAEPAGASERADTPAAVGPTGVSST